MKINSLDSVDSKSAITLFILISCDNKTSFQIIAANNKELKFHQSYFHVLMIECLKILISYDLPESEKSSFFERK